MIWMIWYGVIYDIVYDIVYDMIWYDTWCDYIYDMIWYDYIYMIEDFFFLVNNLENGGFLIKHHLYLPYIRVCSML